MAEHDVDVANLRVTATADIRSAVDQTAALFEAAQRAKEGLDKLGLRFTEFDTKDVAKITSAMDVVHTKITDTAGYFERLGLVVQGVGTIFTEQKIKVSEYAASLGLVKAATTDTAQQIAAIAGSSLALEKATANLGTRLQATAGGLLAMNGNATDLDAKIAPLGPSLELVKKFGTGLGPELRGIGLGLGDMNIKGAGLAEKLIFVGPSLVVIKEGATGLGPELAPLGPALAAINAGVMPTTGAKLTSVGMGLGAIRVEVSAALAGDIDATASALGKLDAGALAAKGSIPGAATAIGALGRSFAMIATSLPGASQGLESFAIAAADNLAPIALLTAEVVALAGAMTTLRGGARLGAISGSVGGGGAAGGMGLGMMASQSGLGRLGAPVAAYGGLAYSLGDRNMVGTWGRNMMMGGFMGSVLGVLPAAIAGKYAYDQVAPYQTSMNIMRAMSFPKGSPLYGSQTETNQMKALGDEAKALGADLEIPATSANDAAQAMLALRRNGLDLTQVMQDARPVILAAVDSNISNADSAKIAAAATRAFGLQGKDLTNVIDMAAAAAVNSSMNLTAFAQAIQAGGQITHAAREDIGQFTTAMALLVNEGMKATYAGTGYKTMLQQEMIPHSAKAAEMQKKLGIDFYDANKQLKNQRDIVVMLTEKTKGMNDEQKLTLLNTLFTTRSVQVMLGLLNAGTEGWDAMDASIKQAMGVTLDMAQARMSGVGGSVEQLRSQMQNLGLTVGERVQGPMTTFFNSLAMMADNLSQANPKLIDMGIAGLGALAVMGPLAIAVGGLAIGVGMLGSPAALAILGTTALVGGLAAKFIFTGLQAANAEKDIKNLANTVGQFYDPTTGHNVTLGGTRTYTAGGHTYTVGSGNQLLPDTNQQAMTDKTLINPAMPGYVTTYENGHWATRNPQGGLVYPGEVGSYNSKTGQYVGGQDYRGANPLGSGYSTTYENGHLVTRGPTGAPLPSGVAGSYDNVAKQFLTKTLEGDANVTIHTFDDKGNAVDIHNIKMAGTITTTVIVNPGGNGADSPGDALRQKIAAGLTPNVDEEKMLRDKYYDMGEGAGKGFVNGIGGALQGLVDVKLPSWFMIALGFIDSLNKNIKFPTLGGYGGGIMDPRSESTTNTNGSLGKDVGGRVTFTGDTAIPDKERYWGGPSMKPASYPVGDILQGKAPADIVQEYNDYVKSHADEIKKSGILSGNIYGQGLDTGVKATMDSHPIPFFVTLGTPGLGIGEKEITDYEHRLGAVLRDESKKNKDIGSQYTAEIVDGMNGSKQIIVRGADGLIHGFQEAFGRHKGDLVEIGNGVVIKIGEGGTAATNTAAKAVSSGFSTGVKGESSATARSVVAAYKDAITTQFTDTDWASEGAMWYANGMKGAFDAMQDGVKAAGYNFAKGYADGIYSGKDLARVASEEMARESLIAAKNTIIAKSPSRATMQIGEYFGQGFALGITNTHHLAQQSARNMALLSMHELLGINPLASISGGIPFMNNHSATTNYNNQRSVVQNVTINVQGGAASSRTLQQVRSLRGAF